MNLLSPGSFFRSLLREDRYDIRNSDGQRVLNVSAAEADSLQAQGMVWATLDCRGAIRYLAAMTSTRRIRKALDKANGEPTSAEDNRTVVREGQTYRPHMRRAMAFQRSRMA